MAHGRGLVVAVAGDDSISSSVVCMASEGPGARCLSGRRGPRGAEETVRACRGASEPCTRSREPTPYARAAQQADGRSPPVPVPWGSSLSRLPGCFEATHRLVHVDLASRDLLHELDARRRGRGGAFDSKLQKQAVVARPRGGVAHPEVPLELLHVSAGREEDPQNVAVLVAEHAELAACERARKLGGALGAREPGGCQPVVAHGAARRRAAGLCFRHQPTLTLTSPIVQLMSRTPAPVPMTWSRTPSTSTLPSVVWALMRTLDALSRFTLTSPIWQRIALLPPSRRPVASRLPAETVRLTGPAKPSTMQLPACTSQVIGPLTPRIATFPACTLVRRASDGFMRTTSLSRVLKPGIEIRERLNSKVVSPARSDWSITIVSPSWRARWGPSATVADTEGSPTISVLPN